MNAIVNNLLLTEDKFITEIYLRQPVFTYISCGPFTENKEKMKKIMKQKIPDIFIKTN